MSYDINLVRIPPGSNPQAVIQASLAAEEEGQLNPGEPDPTKEETKRRLAAALQAVNPLLGAFPFDYSELARLENISEDEARRRFRHIELDSPDDGSGIQITLFDDTANITIPYWHHGRNGEEVLREAWSYLEVLEHDGGFRAYDPQLERLVFLRTDFSAVLAMYAQGVSFTDKMDQKDASSTPDYSPDTERRELRRLRRLTLAGQAIILAILIALLYPVVRFPAATLPAVLMALVGLYRNRSMAALPSPKGWLDRDPPAPDKLDDRFESLFGRILAWSLPGGALGYAALAAVGIGVPAPEVAVGWRVFGGLVVGAMAGVAAAWALWALPLLTRGPRAA